MIEEKVGESRCANCNEIVLDTDTFCTHCGYPQNGTEEQKREYLNKKSEISKEEADARKKIRVGTTTLFVLTGLALLAGLVLLGAGDEDYFNLGLGTLILGIVYLALGLWSRKAPFPALITAVILYGTLVVASIAMGSVNGLQIAVQALILVLLISGLMGAARLRKMKSGA